MISPEHEAQELHVCVQVLEHQHGGRKGPPIGQALTGLIKLSNTVLPAMSPAQACSHRCLSSHSSCVQCLDLLWCKSGVQCASASLANFDATPTLLRSWKGNVVGKSADTVSFPMLYGRMITGNAVQGIQLSNLVYECASCPEEECADTHV